MRAIRLALALVAAGAGSAGAQVTVYANDFEANTAGITGTVSRIAYPGGCSAGSITGCGSYLGGAGGVPFNGIQSFAVNLAGLPVHTGLRISFQYLPIHSMDGSDFGPDGFSLVGPTGTLIDATFSNWDGNRQSYCPVGPVDAAGLCARWNGAAEVNTLGYTFCCGNQVGSSVYALSFDVVHSASTATFTFNPRTNQGWDDEGAGFDNIRVEALGAVAAVPEPATVALLGGGLLALGAVARRRRA